MAGRLVLWRGSLLGHGHHCLAANRSMEGLDHTCTLSPLRGCWEGGCRNLCFISLGVLILVCNRRVVFCQ